MAGNERMWAGTEASLQAYLDAQAQVQTMEVRADDDEEDDNPYLLEIEGSVGIVSIKGSLTNRDSYWNRYLGVTSYNAIREAMVSAAANPEVSTILLDIDSGGGAVNGCMDTANLIRMVNDKVKPVTAFADGSMMSGAYWLGMAAGNVYAGKTAAVGSIGVISTHTEYSKQMKDDGIGVTVMRAGKFKALANPYEPLSDEGKASLQRMLDATYNVFIDHVATMRGKTVQFVDENMAQGREFIGEAAVGVGLVDGITTFDAVVSKLEAQALDNAQQIKQDSYQQQNPYNKGISNMGKKVLTEQAIAALAEGGIAAEANQESQVESEAAEVAAAEAAAAEAVAAAAPAEAAADTPAEVAAAAAPADTGIITYLQSQVAEKDKALLEANVELSQIRKEHDEFSAAISGLVEVAVNSLNNMTVALGGSAIYKADMAPLAALTEHKRVTDQFKSKIKAGGVAAVDAADASAEDVQIDPLQRRRLASVRSTAQAK